jgi:hypothetical protein
VAGLPVYVFDKLDGSNVRVEVDRKGRLTKFGKREGLLDDQTPFLREAETLIPQKYGDDLGRIVRDERWERATFYFEFWGPGSFAGWHADEPHTVTLFDVAPHKKGFLEPREFLKVCGHLDHAKLLHQGNFTKDIADAISEGTLPEMTFEGVVAKGQWDRKRGMPLMFKWKNLAWFDKLRNRCNGDEKLFESLA